MTNLENFSNLVLLVLLLSSLRLLLLITYDYSHLSFPFDVSDSYNQIFSTIKNESSKRRNSLLKNFIKTAIAKGKLVLLPVLSIETLSEMQNGFNFFFFFLTGLISDRELKFFEKLQI